MTLLSGPTALYQVARAVLDEVTRQLAAGPTSKVSRVGIVPGQIAWDECGTGDCGQLALTMTRAYYGDSIDSPADPSQSGCEAAFVIADYTLQLIRCAPTGAGVNPPSVTALDGAAQILMADTWIVNTAVAGQLCEMERDDLIVEWTVRAGTPVGPSGACVGMELAFSVVLQRD